MSTGSGGWKPTSALLAATAVWGATFVTVKDALAASDVFTFLTLRFAVGAVAAAGLALVLKGRNAPAGSRRREDIGARREAEDLRARSDSTRGEGGPPQGRRRSDSPAPRDSAADRHRSDSATRSEPGAGHEQEQDDFARGSEESSRKSEDAARDQERGDFGRGSEERSRKSEDAAHEQEPGDFGRSEESPRKSEGAAHEQEPGDFGRSEESSRKSEDAADEQARGDFARGSEGTRKSEDAAHEQARGEFARGSEESPRKSDSAIRSEAGRSAGFRSVLRPGLQLGVLLFGGYALQTLGLETTTPARSAFITGLTVIFVPFVSWWLNGHRPPTRAFVAPLIALIGLQRLTGVTFSGALPVGDALTLGCAVVYAVHIVGMGKWGKGAPALELTAVQLGLVAVLSACTLPFIERRFEPTPGFWAAVVFTGVFASAIAIAVQVWAQALVNATRAAVIFSLEPVFALATALLSGLGWPSPAELVGCGFILAAVLISEVELAPLRRMRLLSKGP